MSIYAVQTVGGEEKHVRDLIQTITDDSVVDECFVPCSEVARNFRGQWRTVEVVLFPGYIFIETSDPVELKRQLWQVPAFTRVLGVNGVCLPLSETEEAWLNAFTQHGDRTVHMSEGIIEGDEVLILSGPLMNRTAEIKKIDRHKRCAYLEITMLGRTKLVKMGLEIVHKRRAAVA